MLFILIGKPPAPNSKLKKLLKRKTYINNFKNNTMAQVLLDFNNLNSKAMNRKTSIRHSQSYHQEGIGTVTILLAIATVSIIFFSIYNAF